MFCEVIISQSTIKIKLCLTTIFKMRIIVLKHVIKILKSGVIKWKLTERP